MEQTSQESPGVCLCHACAGLYAWTDEDTGALVVVAYVHLEALLPLALNAPDLQEQMEQVGCETTPQPWAGCQHDVFGHGAGVLERHCC